MRPGSSNGMNMEVYDYSKQSTSRLLNNNEFVIITEEVTPGYSTAREITSKHL